MISTAEERGFDKAINEVAKSLLDVIANETIASLLSFLNPKAWFIEIDKEKLIKRLLNLK